MGYLWCPPDIVREHTSLWFRRSKEIFKFLQKKIIILAVCVEILHKFYSSFGRITKIRRLTTTGPERHNVLYYSPNFVHLPLTLPKPRNTVEYCWGFSKCQSWREHDENSFRASNGPKRPIQNYWTLQKPAASLVGPKVTYNQELTVSYSSSHPTQLYTCTPPSMSPKWLGTKTKDRHSTQSIHRRSRDESQSIQGVSL